MSEPRVEQYHVALRTAAGTRVLYEPQPKQLLLHASMARNVLMGGAAGPGKSHSVRWHCILACLRHAGFRALLLRRQFTELEQTHLLAIRTEVPLELAQYDAGRHRLLFPNGSILQFGHCNTDADFTTYLSTEWGLIAIDEAGQFSPWQLTMLPSRLRTTDRQVRPQFVLASNPGGPGHHWLKARFMDHNVAPADDPTYQPEDYDFIPARVVDNRYIAPEYIARLRALPEQERQAYLEGNWDAFTGQVFAEWRRDLHVLPDTFQVPPGWRWSAGLDWGYHNPGCFLLFAQGPDGQAIGWIEWYFQNTLALDAGKRIALMCLPYPVESITYDEQMGYQTGAGELTIVEQFLTGLREGYGKRSFPGLWEGKHGPQSRLPKLALAHEWLRPVPGGLPRLRFHPRCQHTIRTVPALTYSTKRPEDVNTDGEDHAYDALCLWLSSRPRSAEQPNAQVVMDNDTHPGFDAQGDRIRRWIGGEEDAPKGYRNRGPLVRLEDW